jgi:hypothetical protein
MLRPTRSAGVAALLLLVGSVVGGVPELAKTVAPGRQAAPMRMIGKKAVMHVYSYAPKTLEIASVNSHFFEDVAACERAVGGALRAATAHATAGDVADAQCVAIDPPEAIESPEVTHRPAEVTEL